MTSALFALLAYLSCQCAWVEVMDCREERACPGPGTDRRAARRSPDRPQIGVVIQGYVRTLVERRSFDAIGAPSATLPLYVLAPVSLSPTFHGSVVAIRDVSDAVMAARKHGREVNVIKLSQSPAPTGWDGADGTWLLVGTGTVREIPTGPRNPKNAETDWRFVSDGNSEFRVVSGKDGALTFELRSVLAL